MDQDGELEKTEGEVAASQLAQQEKGGTEDESRNKSVKRRRIS